MLKTRHAFAMLPIALAACASKPQDDPAYVSPTQYDQYSCSQMHAEMQRVTSQIDQFSNQKDMGSQLLSTALSAYAISQGYGYGEEDNVELRRAQNKYRILDEMLIKKSCTN